MAFEWIRVTPPVLWAYTSPHSAAPRTQTCWYLQSAPVNMSWDAIKMHRLDYMYASIFPSWPNVLVYFSEAAWDLHPNLAYCEASHCDLSHFYGPCIFHTLGKEYKIYAHRFITVLNRFLANVWAGSCPEMDRRRKFIKSVMLSTSKQSQTFKMWPTRWAAFR